MNTTRKKITDEVIAVVQRVRGSAVKMPPLTLDTHLTRDLNLHTDDATEVCMLVEEKTGISPPRGEWEAVGTIGEIVDLLFKYAR